MRTLVYGLGRSGLAALRLIRAQGHEASFFELREEGDDIEAALALGATRLRDVASADAAVCVAAPGVPIDHPDLASLRASGVEVIGEVAWVARTVPGTYVGVTGTAGKGTVTRWLADMLAGAGRDAVAGGNLDPALAAVARPGALHVVELSSFQLERVPGFRPRVAVALNLGEDHLDRHGTVASYHRAKRNLIAHLGTEEAFVYNADDPLLRGWADETPAKRLAFSLGGPADARLRPDGELELHGAPLLPREALGVQGDHQVANALAVALAAAELGLTHDEIARGLARFEGLPGRYALVAEARGVRFLEDSIATRPLSVRAALEATPAPLVWIAGGRSKGADAGVFRELARERVSLFVGLGEAGPAFAAALADAVPTTVVHEPDGRAAMREAVRLAVAHLRRHHPDGGSVLLAPLAASFDQFRDYGDRAEAFRRAVEEVARWTPSS